jgi:plasmid maintenance system killer protein
LEEALANAHMLRGFKHPTRLLSNSAGAYEALKRFCERQPAGYVDGPEYAKTRTAYLKQSLELSMRYQHASDAWPAPEALDALIFYPDLIRIDWTRCPVFILDEHDLRGKLGLNVSYFQSVEVFEETSDFARSLAKVDKRIQKLWGTRKKDLARSTALKSLDFKQWNMNGRDVYSVRVDGNYRVHLRYDGQDAVWYAESIGNHKSMGHG